VTAGPKADSAARELEIRVAGMQLVLPPTRSFSIGRDPGADLELSDPRVSRQHLVLEPDEGGWTLTDHSRNGTYLSERRITRVTVGGPMTLLLGDASAGVPLELVPHGQNWTPVTERRPVQQGRLSGLHSVRTSRIVVGRLPDNDIVLDDLLVSRRHAELTRVGDTWRLRDLGTGNGTFLNGRRITEAELTPDDVIGIGRTLLRLTGDRLTTFIDDGGNSFEADAVTVTTGKGRTLLHAVSFYLPGPTLLAVIGPSGAGKSTLLGALIGLRPATGGHVRYADRDLYDDYDELRRRIALVPQDDILHTQLTVRQALTYAARLRFPADTTADERQDRIDEVLDELGLAPQADQQITSLSGGQRKRTSVALELLTKPSLLFLDEPTSGLDPGMDRTVMRTLRAIADDQRTVVVVTHNVANLAICDQVLLLAPGGKVAYFGPPARALEYFDQADFADVFLLLETEPAEHWAQRFADHQRLGTGGARRTVEPESAPRKVTPTGPRQQGALTQLAVLARRYLAVVTSDRQYAISLVVLPIMLSLLARVVPGSAGLSVAAAQPHLDTQPAQLLLVLVIGAGLMGAAASVRELVKERPVYRRERAIGVSIGAYLTSKILVLAGITGLQAVLFTSLSLVGRRPPDDPLLLRFGQAEILVAVLGVTWASMLIGLVISALIDNADRGMPLLVFLVMVQLIFCGGLFPMSGRAGLEQVSWLVPSRWAFSMGAATLDLNRAPYQPGDESWRHSLPVWFASAVLLCAIMIVLTAVVAVLLTRLDPRRRRDR
jgi:ABC-type multidrug transport system ATPase subunit/pSer/pThr/pTyr-binding forkhead associated (FHA) protein